MIAGAPRQVDSLHKGSWFQDSRSLMMGMHDLREQGLQALPCHQGSKPHGVLGCFHTTFNRRKSQTDGLTLMPGFSISGLMRVFEAPVSFRAALYAYAPPLGSARVSNSNPLIPARIQSHPCHPKQHLISPSRALLSPICSLKEICNLKETSP